MLEVSRGSRKEMVCFTSGKDRVGCAHREAHVVDGVVKFISNRFGELSVAEERVITFPGGILGFPDAKRYVILDYEGDVPFKWLQSVDDPALAFLVAVPTVVKPDYSLCLKKADLTDLGECNDEDMAILAILTVPEGNPKGMTANLRGPLVINAATMKGKQVVLQDDNYPIRYPIFC
jgi:flagellar assembly factor FliW